ncbi:MAG: FkbM family methyltransferase [Alphaproteobacteria bacterium]|nr:FkbM family methyltransferase [Alphaproteobacteria bacterium]
MKIGGVPISEIRRLYTRRWWRKTYGQAAEDHLLQDLFAEKDRGFYVDVGAFHPRKYSNTYLLHKKGWRGINIDTSPAKIALFDFDRPRDINICTAVGAESGEGTLYSFEDGRSALDTMDRDTALEWAHVFNKTFTELPMPIRPLSDVLAAHGVTEIDLLNIDVEGYESQVLAGLDFDRHKPARIVCEHHGTIEEILASDVYTTLKNHGYRLVSWHRMSLILTLDAG